MVLVKALAKKLEDWKLETASYEIRLEQHIIKYQLWKSECLIKEIYNYALPAGRYRLKTTGKYPNAELIKEYLFNAWDDFKVYKQDVKNVYNMYKKDYYNVDFDDVSVAYMNVKNFVEKLCELLSKGNPSYDKVYKLVKKYLGE